MGPNNYAKYLLPDTSSLTNEKPFGKVALTWNKEGLEVFALIEQPFQRISYPDISQGDSLEVFIDTRDVKTSGYNTRFCHHFFALAVPPEEKQSSESGETWQAEEISRFRNEDLHELCNPYDLKVQASFKKNNHTLQLFIPTHCLHGYDPDQVSRLGFTYRINRPDGPPQHLSVRSDDYKIEQQPSLWASVKLIP